MTLPEVSLTAARKARISLRRYHQFLLVGVVNATVDLGILNLCMFVAPTHVAQRLLVYNTFAVLCTIATSYLLNRKWTFADQATQSRRQKLLFWLQGALNVVINDVSLSFFSHEIVSVSVLPFAISSDLAKGLAMITSSSISYTILRLFVF